MYCFNIKKVVKTVLYGLFLLVFACNAQSDYSNNVKRVDSDSGSRYSYPGYSGQFGKNGEPLGVNGYADQLYINSITDTNVRRDIQWRYDRAKSFITQADGIERDTDRNAAGVKRTHFTPTALTAADCSPGRHWEVINGVAGCVCDGDTTHTRIGNNEASAIASCNAATAQTTNNPITTASPPPTSNSYSCSGYMLIYGSQVVENPSPSCGYVAFDMCTYYDCGTTTTAAATQPVVATAAAPVEVVTQPVAIAMTSPADPAARPSTPGPTDNSCASGTCGTPSSTTIYWFYDTTQGMDAQNSFYVSVDQATGTATMVNDQNWLSYSGNVESAPSSAIYMGNTYTQDMFNSGVMPDQMVVQPVWNGE